MKRMTLFLSILVLASMACTLGAPTPVLQIAPEPASQAAPTPAEQNLPTEPVVESTATNSSPGVLLFTIGMHIEPFGAKPSALVPHAIASNNQKGDYTVPQFFEKHVDDILLVTKIIESHGGCMTIQTQTPFTTMAISNGNTVLADLAGRGHEIALHFHEDAHLGKNSERLPVDVWCAVLKDEIGFVTQATSSPLGSGVDNIRYWSGGNLYPDLYEAAECAGLDVNSDWKNPELQETPLELVGINPWRPSGGTDGVNLTAFTQHDPNGAIVFLPGGLYTRTDFASMRRAETAGGDEAYFEFLKESLLASLEAAQAGQTNVFHFTIHAGEFRGDKKDPFGVIERFLTEVVDPLVASGQVQWATFSEMADAYAATEK